MGNNIFRLDSFPTHELCGVKYRCGHVQPFGATLMSDGTINFSVFSKEASSCELLLYHRGERDPFLVIPFPEDFRIVNVFSMMVFDLNYEEDQLP